MVALAHMVVAILRQPAQQKEQNASRQKLHKEQLQKCKRDINQVFRLTSQEGEKESQSRNPQWNYQRSQCFRGPQCHKNLGQTCNPHTEFKDSVKTQFQMQNGRECRGSQHYSNDLIQHIHSANDHRKSKCHYYTHYQHCHLPFANICISNAVITSLLVLLFSLIAISPVSDAKPTTTDKLQGRSAIIDADESRRIYAISIPNLYQVS